MYNNLEDRMFIVFFNFFVLLYVFVFFYIKEMDLMKGVQDIIRCDVCLNNEWEKLLVEV